MNIIDRATSLATESQLMIVCIWGILPQMGQHNTADWVVKRVCLKKNIKKAIIIIRVFVYMHITYIHMYIYIYI